MQQAAAAATRSALTRPPAGGGGALRRRRQRVAAAPRAGLFDELFNFESWAPRSSQAWRLGNNPNEGRRAARGDDPAAAAMGESDVELLNQRLAEARQGGGGAAAAESAGGSEGGGEGEDEAPNFLRSTDEEVASALAGRIAEMAAGGGGGGGEGSGLNGPLLRELIYAKWGKTYDLSFVRRDMPGRTLVSLNVMWTHLEQRSFPMSEEEYDEKLELMSLYLNSWGQADRVESFLRQPRRPRGGMPSRPTVGIAVPIQLDLESAVIDEFFSQGGV